MKDLKRKIEKLQERLDSVQEEIDQKYAAADEIEDQIDNLEYGVIKRREGMELLQNVADDKLGLLNFEFQNLMAKMAVRQFLQKKLPKLHYIELSFEKISNIIPLTKS